ncbi:restriction endonuclease subunit S [Enterobacter hormaechei]|uniref:restriction endonuclease subunit S n=1 Tax=Enterobacter hormaechei TaxID=158836 RepID=UPI00188C6498|nr:restriction endonuclease subunit S [Enterobacter hormaechei]MBF4167040.1 restriction endonuclease subunit S [Enterobacter hormaechei]
MAKYKAYPEYKDSGVEWLGVIPKGWTISKVKYLAPFQVGWTPPTKNDANFIGDNLWVNISDLKDKFISSTAKCISDKAAKEASMDITPRGSLLYSFKLSVGAVSFAGCDLYTNEAIASFLDQAQLPLSYLYYALPIFIIENASTNIYGAKILNQELIKNSFLLAPSHSEAKKVAQFLDHETAKIDNLIEKQQQLIELLKEKRQAVISHAVNKGLNPYVPMKDSGVEWLGEVPEHWIIAQLKFNTLEMQTGPFGSQLHAEDYVIDGIPLINPAHMNAGMIIPDPKVTVDEATQERLGRHKLSEGEIIFSRRGELGRCAVVKKNNEGWLCGTGSLKAKLTKKIIPDYAYTLISSEGVVSELTLESKGSTMANLNTETLGRIRLPVPPISEQEAILDYIKIISDKYDYLIRSADTAIRLMQERRTALISAAVTGKIDVRDWVAPDTQDIEESQEAIA